jgi:hypothetical protein
MKARFLSKIFFHGKKAQLNQDHTPIVHSSKKIEPSKDYFIHCSKLAIPGTPSVQPLFLIPQSSVYFANFSQGWIA